MSRLFPDHIRLGLGSSYAALAQTRGREIVEWRMQEFTPAETPPLWQQSLEAVATWLRELPLPKNAKVSVLLSSELALLHLMPWRDDITRAEQQRLLALGFFRRVYGRAAEQGRVAVWPTAYAAPWIASMADENLLLALQAMLDSHKSRLNLRLVSVEPLTLGLFNALRRNLDEACWFLAQEPKRLTALHIRNKRWQLLQTLPDDALPDDTQQPDGLDALLLRETRLAGLPDQAAAVYIVNNEAASSHGQSQRDSTQRAYTEHPYISLPSGWQVQPSLRTSPLHLIGAMA